VKKILNNIKSNWQDFCDRVKYHSPLIRNYFIALFLISSFLVVYFWPYLNSRVFISIRSGETGVLWQRFFGGTNLDYTYHEGFHIIMPWDQMFLYNVRLQQTPHHIVALCKNGLPVELEVSIRHRPSDRKLTLLHSVVGTNYVETVVKPEVEALVRTIVSQFEPNELYTSEGYILNLIVQGSMSKLSERYVSLDALLIKRISLPTKIADSIEAKLIEEQRLFEYEYRVKQAQKEAERKWYEAQGILEFQKTVAAGGSFRDYLRYTGIQATVELSKSNNTKLVVIGGAESNGLPLILNLPSDEGERKAADSILNKSINAVTTSGPNPASRPPSFSTPPTPSAPPQNIAPSNSVSDPKDAPPKPNSLDEIRPQASSSETNPQGKSVTP
jgi:prohibitin 2